MDNDQNKYFHKWLFQPKDSALIMFRDSECANAATSFGGGYLADLNIGVQSSREATAIPLLATLMAWGRTGIVDRIDRAMSRANLLADKLSKEEGISLWAMPKTWEIHDVLKWLIVFTSSFIIIMALYTLLIRKFELFRFLSYTCHIFFRHSFANFFLGRPHPLEHTQSHTALWHQQGQYSRWGQKGVILQPHPRRSNLNRQVLVLVPGPG